MSSYVLFAITASIMEHINFGPVTYFVKVLLVKKLLSPAVYFAHDARPVESELKKLALTSISVITCSM